MSRAYWASVLNLSCLVSVWNIDLAGGSQLGEQCLCVCWVLRPSFPSVRFVSLHLRLRLHLQTRTGGTEYMDGWSSYMLTTCLLIWAIH